MTTFVVAVDLLCDPLAVVGCALKFVVVGSPLSFINHIKMAPVAKRVAVDFSSPPRFAIEYSKDDGDDLEYVCFAINDDKLDANGIYEELKGVAPEFFDGKVLEDSQVLKLLGMIVEKRSGGGGGGDGGGARYQPIDQHHHSCTHQCLSHSLEHFR